MDLVVGWSICQITKFTISTMSANYIYLVLLERGDPEAFHQTSESVGRTLPSAVVGRVKKFVEKSFDEFLCVWLNDRGKGGKTAGNGLLYRLGGRVQVVQ